MVRIKILLALIMMLSSQSYASSGNSDEIEIQRVVYYAGKWHIRYNDVAQSPNLSNEEVFVDGVADRIVNAGAYGTDLERGYSLTGSYSTDICHKAYIILYNQEHNKVSESPLFKFGNLSKCEDTVEEGNFTIKRIFNYAGKWYIRYKDMAVSPTLDKEELFVDGVLDRIVNAGSYSTDLERGYSLHGSYDKNSCHEAYLLAYDYEHKIVQKTAIFNFGNTSKCGVNDGNLTKGLVAYYEFEGNADDSSGNGNNGVAHGGVTYLEGVIGQAGSFDGVDDKIIVNNDLSLNFNTSQFSISAWVNTSQHKIWKRIVTKRGATNIENWYSLAIHNGKARFEIYASKNLDSNIDISDNSWHLITITRNSENRKFSMYIDGIFEISMVDEGKNLDSANAPLEIGIWNNEYYDNSIFKGLIDDLRIYNRALTTEEIKKLYKLGRNSGLTGTSNASE